MRYAFLLFIFIFSCSEDSKKTEPVVTNTPSQDSLAKYSYLIYGYKKDRDKIEIGTVFFIKKGNDTYLIGANHSFAGFTLKGEKDNDYPDTMFIRLRNKMTNAFDPIPIDIREYKKEYKSGVFYEKADMHIQKIEGLSKYEIYTIESFINPEEELDKLEMVKGFGYSYSQLSELRNYNPPIEFKGKLALPYSYEVVYTDLGNIHDKINFVFVPPIFNKISGASGSPVFLLYPDGKYAFAGVFVAGSNNVYIAVKAKYIEEYLNKF